jgi:hypothetical protein
LTKLRQRGSLPPPTGGQAAGSGPRGRRRLYLAAGTALVLVGLALFVTWPPRDRAKASVARLEAVQGEVYVVADERTIPAATGQELLAGQGLRTVGEDSSVTVRFPDATRLELSLNTLVRLDWAAAGRKVFLAEGLVTAEVPQHPAGEPMVVDTTEAEVTLPAAPAAQTRFRLSGTPGSLHVELASGAVAVTRHSDGQSLRLKTGEYALITPRAGPLVARPLPPQLDPPAALLSGHTDRVASLAFSADGRTLVSGAADGTVRFWDVAGRQQHGLLALGGRVSSVFFFPNGQTLATVAAPPDADASVELRDLPGLRRLAAFPAITHVHELRTTVFAPDGRTLASVDGQRNIHLWDVASQQLKDTFRTRKGRILCLDFSLDGQELTAVDEYGQVTAWRLNTGRVQTTFRLESYQGDRVCAAFSPDRRRFVTGTRSGTVQLWEAHSGKLLATLHGHRSAVYCLAFSADGQLLASGSRDGTARLWDMAGTEELATLPAGRGYVRAVAFSLDGQTLAIGSGDGTVKLWDLKGLRHDLNGVRPG